MRQLLPILAIAPLIALATLIIWAHELARPFMQIRRQLAVEADEEGG